MRCRFVLACLTLGLCLSVVSGLTADTVELLNGDSLSGKVIALDAKTLKLKNDILGEMTIERAKIASIHLGDAPVEKKKPAPTVTAIPGPQDVVNQLRTQGLDPAALSEIKKAFPLLATPEAGKYFDNAVSGLVSGNLNIQDIRK